MNQLNPRPGRMRVEVRPQGDWRYLSFWVLALGPGEVEEGGSGGLELALVPLSGRVRVEVEGQAFELSRRDVFSGPPSLLYLPPGSAYRIRALGQAELALGGAPAEGRYPLRLFRPEEMRVEMRRGANALRQVTHILGPYLPAERLVLYEVYIPSGYWSGWPPHRHDGRMGSLYIEETYYYKIQPAHGFAIHRNTAPRTAWTSFCWPKTAT
ncbi:hypothetical protein TJA_23650 [Thermus sp. LT1-2-5]